MKVLGVLGRSFWNGLSWVVPIDGKSGLMVELVGEECSKVLESATEYLGPCGPTIVHYRQPPLSLEERIARIEQKLAL